jgi:beta-glucanase (GH16 family)
VFSPRPRALGAGLVVALAALLTGCGNAPELPTGPVPQGQVPAAPTTTTAAPTPAPTTTAAAPTTTTPRSTTSRPPRTSTTERTPVAVPAAAEADPVAWRPAGGDEFGGALNKGTWSAYDSGGGFGNGLRKPDAVSQANGILTITGTAHEGDGVSGGVRYADGQLYGRYEFRARTDRGKGFSAAILLWPDSEQWPRDGELDIMEAPTPNRDVAHTFVHYAVGDSDRSVHGAHPGDYTRWHTFRMDWLPDRITWYVDGVERFETTDRTVIPTKPMHPTIQLDQGPKVNWMDGPDESTPAEVKLQVDWFRIYEAP